MADLTIEGPKTVRPVHLFPEHKNPKLAAIVLHVAIVPRPTYKAWAYENDGLLAENRKTLRALQKEYPREHDCPLCEGATTVLEAKEDAAPEKVKCPRCDGHGLISDYPDVHQPGFTVPTVLPRIEDLQRRAVAAAARGIDGVTVPGIDATQVAALVEHVGWLSTAYAAVMTNQNPEEQEVFSSGS